MRDIKFRYWNEVIGKLVYEPKIRQNYWFSLNDYINEERGWKWMQFTGLKDKNGKEIYEGDILKGTKGDLWEVYFRERWASFCLTWNGTTTLFGENFLAKESEIIGNTYENPELLNQE